MMKGKAATSSHINPYALEEPERVESSVARSRRARNAAQRVDDEVEFAFEIGGGLLAEVRRLQGFLGERDKAIQDMKKERVDLERIVETQRATIKRNEKLIDELRSELEVSVRKLQTLTESQASVQRLESEHERVTKSLTAVRDQHKNEVERLQTIIEDMKARHETDIAQARKYGAGLAGNTGRASTNCRSVDVARGFFPREDLGVSPKPSSVHKAFVAENHRSKEIEALQQRLAHAQRQNNLLKGSLSEKPLRMRLEGAEYEEGEEDDYVDVDEDTAVTENKKVVKRVTPCKVGSGRGRGITLVQRFAAATPASQHQGEDEEHLNDVRPIPSQEEVSQSFGSSQDHGREVQDELVQEAWSWIDLPP